MKKLFKSPGERKTDFLSPFEWSFHLVPPNEREVCLFYECCREALREEPGDEYRWRPWLSLSKADRKHPNKSGSSGSGEKSVRDMAQFTAPLHAISYSVTEEWLTKGIYPGRAKTLAVFAIDWAASDSELKLDFADWLDQRRAEPKSLAFKCKGGKSKPGRKKDVNMELVDLAIFRAKNSGYTTKAINEHFSPLLHGLDHYFKKGGLNSQEVYDARERVRSRMKHWPI